MPKFRQIIKKIIFWLTTQIQIQVLNELHNFPITTFMPTIMK